jgi:putative copper export protein
MDTPATGSAAASRGSQNLTYAILAGVVVVGFIFAFSGSAAVFNNWYSLFKAGHVIFAVIWVGGGVSILIHAIRAQTARDPDGIVTVAKQAAFMGEKVFAPVGLVTFLMDQKGEIDRLAIPFEPSVKAIEFTRVKNP